jgi:hypothetical protein
MLHLVKDVAECSRRADKQTIVTAHNSFVLKKLRVEALFRSTGK